MKQATQQLYKHICLWGLRLILVLATLFWLTRTTFMSTPVIWDRLHGVSLPTGYQVMGIDISQYQRNIDWKRVKQDRITGQPIRFVFIKATEGISRQDPLFPKYWQEAHAAGFACGAYHFFYSTRNPLLQAKNFENQVKLRAGDLPPVLDAEVTNHQPDSVIRHTMRIWLVEIQRYYGVKPIIYTNLSFYRKYVKGYFDDYPLWIAQHKATSNPKDMTNWLFWQISDEARIQGIPGHIDLNIFHGDLQDFRQICLPK
ncbi:MAG: glycoside hydrolase family 25 protein [Thermoflavifilum sp.]|nr:glycoside hydrolase family 25 protein [Thermoflavifilum sp.]